MLKNHELIQTEDGSLSAYSKTYGENLHNIAGAATETITHYIEGCSIKEKAQEEKELVILEVGLGLGVGVEQTFLALQDRAAKTRFITLEIDPELVEYLKGSRPLFKDLTPGPYGHRAIIGNFTLDIVMGDARQSLPRLKKEFSSKVNAIYQDAFSPKRNAALWTREWFELLRELAAPDCALSTYSSSSSVRKAMLAAGWKLRKGVKFGPKRSSTRAYLQGESDPDILERLQRSPAVALTDALAPDYHL